MGEYVKNKNELNLPEGWEVFDIKEKKGRGEKHFYKRYVHKESKSGLIYFSTEKEGKRLFVVEEYGIGTIDPETFKQVAGSAPVQRYENEDEDYAEKTLIDLMKKTTALWIGHP